jgi:MFS family permease
VQPIALARKVVGSEITALCLVVFLADVTGGIVSPTLSLFAASLGLSVATVGLLATSASVTQLFTALPVGITSDRIGRPRLLRLGLFGAAVATLMMSMATGAGLLFAGRIVLALAAIMTFQIAAAHLGDITEPGRRSFAFGCYTTAMGLGFGLGPLIGGLVSENYGTEVAYRVAACIALVGFVVALRRLHDHTGAVRKASVSGTRLLSGLGEVVRRQRIVLACLGNLLMAMAFIGAISTFFPLYGDHLLLGQAVIGVMFAVRAFSSTLGRVPNGILARKFGSQTIMLAALLLDGAVMFAIFGTSNTTVLMVCLGLDGLAFGAYLVAGQTFIAENTEIELRGSAAGLYSTASGVGGILGTFGLGMIASRWDVPVVYPVTGIVMVFGFVVCLSMALRLRPQPSTGDAVVAGTPVDPA